MFEKKKEQEWMREGSADAQVMTEVCGYAKVLDRLRNLCSRREYCSADVIKKAEAGLRKYPDNNVKDLSEASASILDSLIKDKYVDDSRYAAAYAREKSSIYGWGPAKISYALSCKGVDREIIKKAFGEVDVAASDAKLVKLLQNKSRSLEKDPQRRMKLIRFALGRGYSYDKVIKVISSFMLSEK